MNRKPKAAAAAKGGRGFLTEEDMAEALRGALIIGQSGGPTAVINASAYGVIRTALDADCITKVYGAHYGIKGVLNDRLYIMDAEDREDLDKLMYTPSSALGSCRYKMKDPAEDETDYKRILEIFKKYDVRYFCYNGGNDSMDKYTRNFLIISLFSLRRFIPER